MRGVGAAGAVEALEHMLYVCFCHTDSGILHLQVQVSVVGTSGGDIDINIGGGDEFGGMPGGGFESEETFEEPTETEAEPTMTPEA